VAREVIITAKDSAVPGQEEPIRRPRVTVELILSVISPILILSLWEGLVRAGRLNALFFPPPTVVFQTIYQLTVSGELPAEVGVSLRRVLYGFVLGAAPAVIIGLSMGWSRRVRAFVEPIIAATYPVPKIALLPMIMLIFGIGEASKIVIIAVGAFFPAAINAAAGVLGISPTFFEVARNFGAGRYKTFMRVVLPGSLPIVFTGLRLGFGMALLLVVAAEFVAAREGVGAMIWLAWQTLRTERLYAGVVTWAALGLVTTRLLQGLERRLVRWSR
jgi:NitT/TauT family transport system permease protein